MDTIRIRAIVERDGEIVVQGLPCKKGQQVDVTVQIPAELTRATPLTARALLDSELVGLWADRNDIDRSDEYARRLREQAQTRHR
jgi:hypothetical protein